MIKSLFFLAIFFSFYLSSAAQITLLDSFDPAEANDLCGVAYNPDSSHVWVYGCFGSEIQRYSTTGALISSVVAAGESANDVDVEISPEQLMLAGSIIPQGQVLFVNGEADEADIYAIDPVSGNVIDTLNTAFGVSHVVGGSYHPIRNTFFLVQDNVPGTEDANRIAEIDPITGDTLQTFKISSNFDVSYGDIEVATSGNLFIVSSIQSSIAEFTPDGIFVKLHELPAGVSGLSGIALDCAVNEAWVSSTTGPVYHLGQFPCETGIGVENVKQQPFELSSTSPNPFSTSAEFYVSMKQAGDLRIVLLNMFGQEVQLIFDGHLTGKRIFSISGTPLQGGPYVVKAASNGFIKVQQIITLN